MFQNTTVATANLILGNYKIETAASVAAAYVNLGAGMVNKFGHNIEKYNVQAGNAPDPLEGIAAETFTIDMELIEYDASVLSAISCGAMTAASSGTVMTVVGGGNQMLTPRVFRLTNTRMIGGATKQTIITVFKATCDNGIQFTAKSDNDTDPINVMPITVTGKNDPTLTAGSQLFSIVKTI